MNDSEEHLRLERITAAAMEYVTLAEAREILAARGMPMAATWIRDKAAKGKIPGAKKVSPRLWMIPREWAETYIKDKRGRKRQ